MFYSYIKSSHLYLGYKALLHYRFLEKKLFSDEISAVYCSYKRK